ncbi:hypothetical protein FH972_019598 [Carpinus fangiana]|uniref:Uncharacterized protein n=1 Tax=Carpinus fangiana TaxID=176857 RepID=A0A5N6RTK4_9ROSI|nr:hypothetical protein FH972_019598 [Carpinus fangiana]
MVGADSASWWPAAWPLDGVAGVGGWYPSSHDAPERAHEAETGFEIDNFHEQSSPETPMPGWVCQRPVMGWSQIAPEPFIDSSSHLVSSNSTGIRNGMGVSLPESTFSACRNTSGGLISYFTEMAASSPLPYSFSLLGGGF